MSNKYPVALGEFILVQLYDPEDRVSRGGILLPAALAEDKKTLEVKSKGSKVDIVVEVGDIVELSEGIRINFFYGPNEEKLGVVHQKYVAAVWRDKNVE